jgi:hypothetical protein
LQHPDENDDNRDDEDFTDNEADEEPKHPLDDPELITTSVARAGQVVPEVCFNVEYRKAARRFIERDLKVLGKGRDWQMPLSHFGGQLDSSESQDFLKEIRRFAEMHGTTVRIIPVPNLPEYREIQQERRTQQEPFPPCPVKYTAAVVSRSGDETEVTYTVVPISHHVAFEQKVFCEFKQGLAEVVPHVTEMFKKSNANVPQGNRRKDPTIAQLRDHNLLLRKVAAIAMLGLWPKDTSILAAYYRQFATHFSRDRLKAVEGTVEMCSDFFSLQFIISFASFSFLMNSYLSNRCCARTCITDAGRS